MLKAIVVFIVIYLLIVVGIFLAQRQLIYLPGNALPEKSQWEMHGLRSVQLKTTDALTLQAWYKPATSKQQWTIVYFPGNAGLAIQRLKDLTPYLEQGFGLLLVAYRGYSGNPGKPYEEGLYQDGRAAIDYLERQSVALSDIVLYGESLGSGVAVQMGTEYAVGALILQAPFASLMDVAQDHYPWLPRGLLKDHYDSVNKIAAVTAPVLIIHGSNDTFVLPESSDKLYQKAFAPKQRVLVPGADHNNLTTYPIEQVVFGFLDDND